MDVKVAEIQLIINFLNNKRMEKSNQPGQAHLQAMFIYEEERVANKEVVSAFLAELSCGICNYILKEPLECSSCEKAMCSQCQEIWSAKNHACPFCRKAVHFRKVNRMTRNLLGKIKFYCIHKERGCSETVDYEQLFRHQSTCQTMYFKCEKCTYIGQVDEKETHDCIEYFKVKTGSLEAENKHQKEQIEFLTGGSKQPFANKMFYFAKLHQHAFYDFQKLKWTSFKIYNRKISEGKIVVLDKSNILILGGYESEQFDWSYDLPSAAILKLNIISKQFTTLAYMISNRIYFGIAQEGKEIYIVGGSLKGSDLKACESFNVENHEQKTLPSLQQALRGPNCCSFQKRYIYVVGYEINRNQTSIQQLDFERGSWMVLSMLQEHRIWLVGLHMIDVDNMILYGGQAIHDNNKKYQSIMKFNIRTNVLDVMQKQLFKEDKFFFNNQNIFDEESNCIYSMGRDYIHKINLDKFTSFVPDVGYVEYYS